MTRMNKYQAIKTIVDGIEFESRVEDTKGMKTDKYIIKRKLMLWLHGIKIREV